MKLSKPMIPLLVVLTGCSGGGSFNYTGRIAGCIDANDAALLNESCTIFEQVLEEKYHAEDITTAYLEFVSDFTTLDFTPDFFLHKEAIRQVKKLKSEGTFDHIWTTYNPYGNYSSDVVFEVPPGEGNAQETFFIIDPQSDFMTCVKEKNQNSNLDPFIDFLTRSSGASLSWGAMDLQRNLTKSDLDDGLVRLMIAVGLYYNMAQMFESDLAN